MCGIAGIVNRKIQLIPDIRNHLMLMNKIQQHRGPDEEGIWINESQTAGFAHRRLSIIDLTTGQQPMSDDSGNCIILNGEIYNYLELKQELKSIYKFKTTSDTEVVLAAYMQWGEECVSHLRGMFAFAIWNSKEKKLFCARDRFGIKPFYYVYTENTFYFASEAKALLPFLDNVETDLDALKDYIIFQFTLGEKTLFKNIKQLLPAHSAEIKNGNLIIKKYWEVLYQLDWTHTKQYFEQKVRELLEDSIKYHLRSDVSVGAYLSGGIDSTLMATIARKFMPDKEFKTFNGRFNISKEYDESEYAEEVADKNNMYLHMIDITSDDFIENIRKVIYYLDYPVA